jgi:hypothetical protein
LPAFCGKLLVGSVLTPGSDEERWGAYRLTTKWRLLFRGWRLDDLDERGSGSLLRFGDDLLTEAA